VEYYQTSNPALWIITTHKILHCLVLKHIRYCIGENNHIPDIAMFSTTTNHILNVEYYNSSDPALWTTSTHQIQQCRLVPYIRSCNVEYYHSSDPTMWSRTTHQIKQCGVLPRFIYFNVDYYKSSNTAMCSTTTHHYLQCEVLQYIRSCNVVYYNTSNPAI